MLGGIQMNTALLTAVEQFLRENDVKLKDTRKSPQDPYYYKTYKDSKENSALLTIR